MVNPCLPMRHITHRPEGSSRSLGNTGSGCSNSSYEGSTGTSRSPPRRRRGRLPGSPDQQTPTLEGCTEKPTLAAAPCWGRPVPERVRAAWGRRHLVTGCRAPRLRRGSEAERCRPSQGWGVEGRACPEPGVGGGTLGGSSRHSLSLGRGPPTGGLEPRPSA